MSRLTHPLFQRMFLLMGPFALQSDQGVLSDVPAVFRVASSGCLGQGFGDEVRQLGFARVHGNQCPVSPDEK